jgi:flagellar assembly factor FliW
MAQVETEYFGTMSYREDSVFEFPAGLPAFLDEKRFVPIESPRHSPLLFCKAWPGPRFVFWRFPFK